MNRGVYQSSAVQEMMEGSHGSWWISNNNMRPPQQTFPHLPSSSSSSTTSSSSSAFSHQYPLPSSSFPSTPWHDNQDMPPESWSQLLLGGLVGEEFRCGLTPFQTKLENWVQPASNSMLDVKNETSETNAYMHGHYNDEIQRATVARSSWNHQMIPVSSPRSSCITSLSSNMLDFSNLKVEGRHPKPDHSSECNSSITGSSFKKARVQSSSNPQSTFKVRKEKLGDRITVLHQLVSPFGKTDTASVLLEAIGYIRFLQGQIEALSSPYLGTAPASTRHSVQGERSSCIFPEDSGQLLDDACRKRRVACEKKGGDDEPKKDLRSRGLCLVPISCTMHVGSDNGADYWAPAFCGGFR